MSGRQTLIVLLVFTALAGIAWAWVGGVHSRYQQANVAGRAQLKYSVETLEELGRRLKTLVVVDDEIGATSHFQRQAMFALIGSVNATRRAVRGSNFEDQVYTIEFESESKQFSREQISAFVFNSESQMPRMRTTVLQLAPAPPGGGRGKLDAGAPRQDVWRVEKLAFTQRTPLAKEGR